MHLELDDPEAAALVQLLRRFTDVDLSEPRLDPLRAILAKLERSHSAEPPPTPIRASKTKIGRARQKLRIFFRRHWFVSGVGAEIASKRIDEWLTEEFAEVWKHLASPSPQPPPQPKRPAARARILAENVPVQAAKHDQHAYRSSLIYPIKAHSAKALPNGVIYYAKSGAKRVCAANEGRAIFVGTYEDAPFAEPPIFSIKIMHKDNLYTWYRGWGLTTIEVGTAVHRNTEIATLLEGVLFFMVTKDNQTVDQMAHLPGFTGRRFPLGNQPSRPEMDLVSAPWGCHPHP